MSRKVLFENAVAVTLAQAFSIGLPLIAMPYLASTLGATGLGRVAFAVTTAQLLAVLTDYGFELTGSRLVAVHRDDAARVTRIWCAISAAKMLLMAIGSLLVGIMLMVTDRFREDGILIGAACVLVLGNVLLPQWLFQGLERLKGVSAIQVAVRILLVCMMFYLVRSEADVLEATILLSAGPLMAALACMPATIQVLRRGRLLSPHWRDVMQHMTDGYQVFASTAAVSLYTTVNTLLLGLVVTPAVLGQYHFADRAIRAAQALYGQVSVAVYPHVARLAFDQPALVRFNRKFFFGMLLASSLTGIAIYVSAPLMVSAFLGEDYPLTAEALQILALLPVIVAVSNVLGVQTMLPLRMDRCFTRILVAAAGFNMVIFFPAVSAGGALGAAWTNVLVEAFVAAAMALTVRRWFASGGGGLTKSSTDIGS